MLPIQTTDHVESLKKNVARLCEEKNVDVKDLLTSKGVELEELLSNIEK